MKEIMGVLGPARTWKMFEPLQARCDELRGMAGTAQAFWLEGVMWFALRQRTKHAACGILKKPMDDLKEQKLLCRDTDLQPTLLNEAKRIVGSGAAAAKKAAK